MLLAGLLADREMINRVVYQLWTFGSRGNIIFWCSVELGHIPQKLDFVDSLLPHPWQGAGGECSTDGGCASSSWPFLPLVWSRCLYPGYAFFFAVCCRLPPKASIQEAVVQVSVSRSAECTCVWPPCRGGGSRQVPVEASPWRAGSHQLTP